jgi:hypothetical protein
MQPKAIRYFYIIKIKETLVVGRNPCLSVFLLCTSFYPLLCCEIGGILAVVSFAKRMAVWLAAGLSRDPPSLYFYLYASHFLYNIHSITDSQFKRYYSILYRECVERAICLYVCYLRILRAICGYISGVLQRQLYRSHHSVFGPVSLPYAFVGGCTHPYTLYSQHSKQIERGMPRCTSYIELCLK